MRKCCFFEILFLYCFPLFINCVMSIDYQIVTYLYRNIANIRNSAMEASLSHYI